MGNSSNDNTQGSLYLDSVLFSLSWTRALEQFSIYLCLLMTHFLSLWTPPYDSGVRSYRHLYSKHGDSSWFRAILTVILILSSRDLFLLVLFSTLSCDFHPTIPTIPPSVPVIFLHQISSHLIRHLVIFTLPISYNFCLRHIVFYSKE